MRRCLRHLGVVIVCGQRLRRARSRCRCCLRPAAGRTPPPLSSNPVRTFLLLVHATAATRTSPPLLSLFSLLFLFFSIISCLSPLFFHPSSLSYMICCISSTVPSLSSLPFPLLLPLPRHPCFPPSCMNDFRVRSNCGNARAQPPWQCHPLSSDTYRTRGCPLHGKARQRCQRY